MASSSQPNNEGSQYETFDQYFDQTFENFTIGDQQEERKKRKKMSLYGKKS